METTGENAQNTHTPKEGTINIVAPRRGAHKHPFVDGIIETPLPWGWKSLTMDRYDGTTDLDEHIHVYLTQIRLYTSDDTIFCKVFPTSLKGASLSWFTRLAPFSVDYFDTLSYQFGVQFATSKTTRSHLSSIHQYTPRGREIVESVRGAPRQASPQHQ